MNISTMQIRLLSFFLFPTSGAPQYFSDLPIASWLLRILLVLRIILESNYVSKNNSKANPLVLKLFVVIYIFPFSNVQVLTYGMINGTKEQFDKLDSERRKY